MSDDSVIDVGEPAPADNGSNGNSSFVSNPASLIASLAGGGGDPMSLLLSQLQAQGSSNPTAALLATFLQSRKQVAQPDPNDVPEDQSASEGQLLLQQERDRSLQELNDTAARLYAELEILRKRNDEIAAAVGACFLCFGTDPLCTECSGRGRPGARLPEPNAYRKYVLPALRCAQLRNNRPLPSRTESSERKISS